MQASVIENNSLIGWDGRGDDHAKCLDGPARMSGNGQRNDIPADDILDELQRLLDSPAFTASARNRRALRLIVEHSLAEPVAKVPAQVLATQIYGRGPDFLSLKDPIVRVEMLRLRKDLSNYYGGEGAGSPLRIRIPKGSYRATFGRAEETPKGASPGPRCDDAFVSGILHAALAGWAGRQEEAAAALRNLVRQEPDLIGSLHERVSREFRDENVARLLVEGLSRAAGIS